ncbi:MAG: YkgJ family cysteine cluster protein [Thermoguttaceae bacterium]|nr:YkgJ family cysteine cluster protein [Thermoguttaceae bacterium]MBR4753322.1 YkgJ family cysteine cluster protein [Thermoguttaceae bacterium]
MEIQRWYSEGLRFGCKQCGRCCGGGSPGYVWTSDEEIQALAKAMGLSRSEFELHFIRLITGRRKSLLERKNYDCVLLASDGKRCSVYNARPVQCRTWPFWDQNVATPTDWARAAKHCPGCNNPNGKLYSQQEIDALREQF